MRHFLEPCRKAGPHDNDIALDDMIFGTALDGAAADFAGTRWLAAAAKIQVFIFMSVILLLGKVVELWPKRAAAGRQ